MPLSQEQFKPLAKRAANNYAKKIKLEKPLATKMKSVFRNINKEIAKNGSAHLEAHRANLEKILNEHHIKTAKAFSNNLRNIVGNPSNNKIVQRKLDANIKAFAAQRSHMMSHQIMDTTRKNLEKASKDAHVTAALSPKKVSHQQIAKLTSENFKNKVEYRPVLISITETQAAAESGKALEYDTMVDLDSDVGGRLVSDMVKKKAWIAILDDHTRFDHADADGQEVDKSEPFEVGGDELMYPGDDSLGAGEDQLCNCRCSCEDVIE